VLVTAIGERHVCFAEVSCGDAATAALMIPARMRVIGPNLWGHSRFHGIPRNNIAVQDIIVIVGFWGGPS